jgi:hypothetical protein
MRDLRHTTGTYVWGLGLVSRRPRGTAGEKWLGIELPTNRAQWLGAGFGISRFRPLLGRSMLVLLASAGSVQFAACGGGISGAAHSTTVPISARTPATPTAVGLLPEGHGYIGPVATPDAACDSPRQETLPVVNPQDSGGVRTKLPHWGYGTGPVYWSGQDVWHAAGEQAEVLVEPRIAAPVVVTFVGPGGSGDATLGGERTTTIAPSRSAAWAYADALFVASIAGCWTMSASYAGTTVLVHFTVAPGQPPPG